MNKAITFKLGILIAILSISFAFSLGPVLAHGDEEIEEKTEMNVEQMEQMVKVLQQLLVLLTQYKAQYGTYVAPVSTYVAPAVVHEEKHEEVTEDHAEATTHDEESTATPTPATTVPTLLIEVESHTGKTHVHVRYPDGKPEAMFFVNSALSNESGVIADIATQTGLSADDIKKALKYTGMNN